MCKRTKISKDMGVDVWVCGPSASRQRAPTITEHDGGNSHQTDNASTDNDDNNTATAVHNDSQDATTADSGSPNTTTVVPVITIHLYTPHSRILWRELVPCLLRNDYDENETKQNNDRDAARRLLYCILSNLTPSKLLLKEKSTTMTDATEQENQSKNDNSTTRMHESLSPISSSYSTADTVWRRRQFRNISKVAPPKWKRALQFWWRQQQQQSHPMTNGSHTGNGINCQPTIFCYLHPCLQTTTRLEDSWEQRLVHWENQLILAQSLAGYFSTLGGGCFMTHRSAQAWWLARQQVRAAQVLGDEEMILKCQINMAYNLIQCGMFQAAKKLIRQVQEYVDPSIHRRKTTTIQPSAATVIAKMCQAALLFCARVQKWTKQQQQEQKQQEGRQENSKHANNTHQSSTPSKVVDDFYRVRVRGELNGR